MQWVAEGSPTHSSTPVKIDAALQFVPKNTNPKEFKKLQQQVSSFLKLLYFILVILLKSNFELSINRTMSLVLCY